LRSVVERMGPGAQAPHPAGNATALARQPSPEMGTIICGKKA